MKPIDIKRPYDIKNMSTKELEEQADEIRKFLIETTSKTGGHLGSSLGTVELIMALHCIFDSPKDKLIFDIGHQAYVHKILTGRTKEFPTLRQYEGLSGFLSPKESEHDIFSSGHAANAISAAVGFAMARDLDKKDHHVVAIIGDGSLTGGMSLEALNHIIALNQRIIIVINDNEMSISPNVGFIDNILKNLEYSKSYDKTKSVVKTNLDKLDSSKTITKFISAQKTKLKNDINTSKGFFNILGFKYYGPIKGHDLVDLIRVLKIAKEYKGPVVIHVKTLKGKGYLPAEQNKWHATPPFDISTGEPLVKTNSLSTSSYVSSLLLELMKKDKDMVIVSPAMIEGSALNEITSKFPDRITDVGIAEEHSATLISGLALAGKRPVLSIYSTFLQRAYDQVFQDVVRQKANVLVIIDRTGLSGGDGETHHGIYDISLLSHMPNAVIVQGRNPVEVKSLIKLGLEYNGPVFIRNSRAGEVDPKFINENYRNISFGTWEKLSLGEKIWIIGYGENIQALSEIYKEDKDIGIIDAKFIKPLDSKMLNNIKDKKLLIVEEHSRLGGLGSLILDFFNKQKDIVDIEINAIEDHFVQQGNVDIVKDKENISLSAIVKQIDQMLSR